MESIDSYSDFDSMSLMEDGMIPPSFPNLMSNDVHCALSDLTTDRSESCSDDDSTEEQEREFSDGDHSSDEKYATEESEKTLRRQKTTHTIDLRMYQRELMEYALCGMNTIICAPTGSGKTRVATYIIQEHMKRSCGEGKKVAFLARVVSLANQQYKSMCKYLTSYQIGIITGESGSSMSLHMLLDKYDIIVMTPMILENHIRNKWIPHLGVFSLLVFDECHHTRKGESYNNLMHSYLRIKYLTNQSRGAGASDIILPQIVGLTASIGIEGAETLEEAKTNILKICANLDVSKIATVEKNKDELKKFVPVPSELTKPLFERADDASVMKIHEVMQTLENHMDEYIKEVQIDTLLTTRPTNRKSQDYELWTVNTIKAAKAVPITKTSKALRLIIIIAQYLKEYRFALETFDLVELEDVMDYLERSFKDLENHEKRIREENTFYKYFIQFKDFVQKRHYDKNPNLHILAETLMEHLIKKDSDSRAIVFVRTRALADALASWLNRCEFPKLRDLEACSFTGSNVSERQGGTSLAKQESIIQSFRVGNIKLIVATSVAEEGLDIPECRLVIRYNHVGNEVTTVQTRGRSRAFGGLSVLLAMNHIYQRECINKARADLMHKAIESIRNMDSFEFQEVVEMNQKEIIEAVQMTDRAEQERKKYSLAVPFKIVCPLCRNVSVDFTKMRTIYEKYRVSIDGNLFKKVWIKTSPPRQIDELEFIGQVKCFGEVGAGKKCFHPLGTVIKYKGVQFIALGIKSIGFSTSNDTEIRQFKQWSKAPYDIIELDGDEIKRYIMEPGYMDRYPLARHDELYDTRSDVTDNRDVTEVKRPF